MTAEHTVNLALRRIDSWVAEIRPTGANLRVLAGRIFSELNQKRPALAWINIESLSDGASQYVLQTADKFGKSFFL